MQREATKEEDEALQVYLPRKTRASTDPKAELRPGCLSGPYYLQNPQQAEAPASSGASIQAGGKGRLAQ